MALDGAAAAWPEPLPADDDLDEDAEDDVEVLSQFWLDLGAEADAQAAPAAAAGPSVAAPLPARPAGQCDTVYTNPKSGMSGVDQDFVKRVVYEASKDSE